MLSPTIAKKYARALFQVGQAEAIQDNLLRELEKVTNLLQENKGLERILLSPAFPIRKRKQIAEAVFSRLGLSKHLLLLLDVLLENKRLRLLQDIFQAYQDILDEAANRIRATLVTPGQLPPELVRAIKDQLELQTGKEVLLNVRLDPSLIGGVLVRIGDEIYDGTLKSQLLNLKEELYKD